MSVFDDVFGDVATPLLLETLGETITFYSAAGGSLAIVASVVLREQQVTGKLVEYEDERLEVFMRRDPGHADGGVTLPKKGDELTRAGDPRSERFGFTGVVLASTADTWLLEFSRPRATAIGRPGVRRG
jgi:hypothetical protein